MACQDAQGRFLFTSQTGAAAVFDRLIKDVELGLLQDPLPREDMYYNLAPGGSALPKGRAAGRGTNSVEACNKQHETLLGGANNSPSVASAVYMDHAGQWNINARIVHKGATDHHVHEYQKLCNANELIQELRRDPRYAHMPVPFPGVTRPKPPTSVGEKLQFYERLDDPGPDDMSDAMRERRDLMEAQLLQPDVEEHNNLLDDPDWQPND